MGEALAEEIETVKSWAHYREILISDGKSGVEADAEISGMLADLGSMDRAAGNDRIGVAAPPFEFDGWLNSEPLSLEGLPASLAVPLPPVGWLGAIPAVPATLVLDENGVLVRVWYGELDSDLAQELARTIAGLSARAAVPSR